MARVTWKMAVLMAIMVIFAILEFQTAEAQYSGCGQCASHANCYVTFNGKYSCRCRGGYVGDGFIGVGNSGCRRRKMRTWQVVVIIIGTFIGTALAIFALVLVGLCLLLSFTNICQGGETEAPSSKWVILRTATLNKRPPQQGVPMATYETNN